MELEFHEAYIEHRYRLSEESKQKQDHIWTCVLNEKLVEFRVGLLALGMQQ